MLTVKLSMHSLFSASGARKSDDAALTFLAQGGSRKSSISSEKTALAAEQPTRCRRRRRKATSTQRVPRPTQSSLGGTDRIKADFRHLREYLWRLSLPIELFLPSALPVCRHRAPCKPFNVIVTSVSLDGSTVLVIKTGVTYTVTHQTTHLLSTHRDGKTLSTRATRSRPHRKPLLGQASSLDVGERIAHALDGGEAKHTDGGRPLA